MEEGRDPPPKKKKTRETEGDKGMKEIEIKPMLEVGCSRRFWELRRPKLF